MFLHCLDSLYIFRVFDLRRKWLQLWFSVHMSCPSENMPSKISAQQVNNNSFHLNWPCQNTWCYYLGHPSIQTFFSNCDLQKLFEMITACKETVNSSLDTSGNNNLNEKEMSGLANLERNIVCHQVRNILPCSFCFVVCSIQYLNYNWKIAYITVLEKLDLATILLSTFKERWISALACKGNIQYLGAKWGKNVLREILIIQKEFQDNGEKSWGLF